MLDDLRALVEFAQAGSIAGAADRLFRTPSAITRQVQRLEAALGAELLDRSPVRGDNADWTTGRPGEGRRTVGTRYSAFV